MAARCYGFWRTMGGLMVVALVMLVASLILLAKGLWQARPLLVLAVTLVAFYAGAQIGIRLERKRITANVQGYIDGIKAQLQAKAAAQMADLDKGREW